MMRRTEDRSSAALTSRKGKTPAGPAGVWSVEMRRNCSIWSKTCKGGVGASSREAAPSAMKRCSTSRCFLALSFAARLREIAGVPGIPWLLLAPGGLFDIAHGNAPSLARSVYAREVHVQLLGLACGGVGRLDLLIRSFRLYHRLSLLHFICLRCGSLWSLAGGWAGWFDAPFHLDPPLDRLSVEGVLRLGHDGAEDLRLRGGEVGQDLAVKVYLGELEPVDEPGVGEAVLAGTGVDTLDPERPEIPLALLAALVSVDAALPDPCGASCGRGRCARCVPCYLSPRRRLSFFSSERVRSVSVLSRRFCLRLFFSSMWLCPARRRLSLPFLRTSKRPAAPWWVFIFGMCPPRFVFFYLRRGSRHGRKAVSPPSCARLVYQTVAYLRAALSLRPFAWGASAWDDPFLGAMTMTMLRPSRLGWLSMRPSSSRSSASLRKSRSPSSGCCTSRPRNMIVTFTLSPPRRKRSTWPRLVLKSWSPILGLSFISRTLTLTCFLRAALRACSFWYLNLP